MKIRALVGAMALVAVSYAAGPAAAVPMAISPEVASQAPALQAENVHYRHYYHVHKWKPRHYKPRSHYGYKPKRRYSRHVRWCLNRYNSYRPSTNRYLAYSGQWRVCHSPYR